MIFWKFFAWLYLLIALTSGVMSLLNGEFDPLWDSVNVATSLVGTFALWAFAYRKKVLSPTIWKTILLVMVTFEAVSYLVFDWYQDLEGVPIPVAVSLDLIFDFAVFVPMFLHSLSSNRVWAEKETLLEDRPRHGPIGRWIRECGTHFVAAASTIAIIFALLLMTNGFISAHKLMEFYDEYFQPPQAPPVLYEAPASDDGARVDLGFSSFSDEDGGWELLRPQTSEEEERSPTWIQLKKGSEGLAITDLTLCPGPKISDAVGPMTSSMRRLPEDIEEILLEAYLSDDERVTENLARTIRCDFELSMWLSNLPQPSLLDVLTTRQEDLEFDLTIRSMAAAALGRIFEAPEAHARLHGYSGGDSSFTVTGHIWSKGGEVVMHMFLFADSEENARAMVRRFLSSLRFDIDDPADEAAVREKTRAALKKIPKVNLVDEAD